MSTGRRKVSQCLCLKTRHASLELSGDVDAAVLVPNWFSVPRYDRCTLHTSRVCRSVFETRVPYVTIDTSN